MASKDKPKTMAGLLTFLVQPGVRSGDILVSLSMREALSQTKLKTICKKCFTLLPYSKGTSGSHANIGKEHWTKSSRQPKITEAVEKQQKCPI